LKHPSLCAGYVIYFVIATVERVIISPDAREIEKEEYHETKGNEKY
jgi:hypothetical protein